MNSLQSMRGLSKGWQKDPPCWTHPSILVGAGFFLTQNFMIEYRITHVINCAEECDSPSWFRELYPEDYAHVPLEDSLRTEIAAYYPAFKNAMDRFLKDPKCIVVYVHCQCGINRSASLALLYTCLKMGFPYEAIFQSMLKQRPCILTNSRFRSDVETIIKKNGN